MIFLNNSHNINYLWLSNKCNLQQDDIERKALFYIIAGNTDLFEKVCSIYNFYHNCINIDYKNTDFCSSSKALIRLGFNLYNGYRDDYTTPLSILGTLDKNNFILAQNAINIRFCYFNLPLACYGG